MCVCVCVCVRVRVCACVCVFNGNEVHCYTGESSKFNQKAGYTLDGSPVHHRANTQIYVFSHTPRGNLACPIDCLSLDCRRKPTQTQGEHANSTQKGPRSPRPGTDPRPFLLCGDSVTHCTTMTFTNVFLFRIYS